MHSLLKHKRLLAASVSVVLLLAMPMGTAFAARQSLTSFKMVVSAGAATCLPHATANVQIVSLGPVEIMNVDVAGLPPKTDFDFFVLQAPTAPFGVSWYQGDIETNGSGSGHQLFIGRFSIETFAVAPGTTAAPQVFTDVPFPDASSNPPFSPIQMYHLGLWFNAPADAVKANCPGGVTPFNGEHNAGVQVLNTSNFDALNGPLRRITP